MMETLRNREEMENLNSQVIDKMRKKYKEKMGVLEAESHSLKAWFFNQIDLIKVAQNESGKYAPQKEVAESIRGGKISLQDDDEQEKIE